MDQLGSVRSTLDAQEYATLQNTFKVSHLVQPKHYMTSQRLLNLQKPKSRERRPQNIYERADFRGLLHADYRDTIKTAFSKNKGGGLLDSQRASSTKNSGMVTQAGQTGQMRSSEGFESTSYNPKAFNQFLKSGIQQASQGRSSRAHTNVGPSNTYDMAASRCY